MNPLLRRMLRSLLMLLLIAGGYAGYEAWTNNFHVVIPGEFYRSGQLDDGQIIAYTKKYGLRSVINLRGENTGMEWYDHEVKEAAEAGVEHIDFRMASKNMVTPEQAKKLVQIMRDVPKPLLIHCNGGANRTGFASAAYLAGVKGADERTAEEQLSFRYGNFPRWAGSSSRMSESFEALQGMLLTGSGSPTTPPAGSK